MVYFGFLGVMLQLSFYTRYKYSPDWISGKLRTRAIYLSALEVCSRRDAIQIHVYLTLPSRIQLRLRRHTT